MIIEWIEERIEEAKKLSPGPWELVEHPTANGETKLEIVSAFGEPLTLKDAQFIVSARETLPLCLRELRKLKKGG